MDASDIDDTPRPARGLAGWLREGLRSALLLKPDWRGLEATPASVVVLVGLSYALAIGFGRLMIVGPAMFYWPAVYVGWLPMLTCALLCWALARAARAPEAGPRPGGAELFALLCAQAVVTGFAYGAAAATPAWRGAAGVVGPDPRRQVELLLFAWIAVAPIRLLWRVAPARALPRVLVAALVAGAVFAGPAWYPVRFWYDAPSAGEKGAREPLAVTQELMELQPRLLAGQLDALASQRPGVVDLYAITFAPYASQDVFMRESAMVADVMAQRFDAAGRVVQLVNNKATATRLPFATPLNLQRAIAAAARRMDRAEDVLFIHLTSHGGSDGELAVDFDPLSIDRVTPQALARWLDEAGVRWRVVSISACYSGSWVAPLSGDGTLVMTAADADHTSYGCGSRSPLTFFGQAMYDEQLRRTWSFEQAFAASRKIIDDRERAAGKKDGYSNPQIAEGASIRRQLAKLAAERAASAASPK